MIRDNIELVRKSIEDIIKKPYEDSSVLLLAVTKQKPISAIVEAKEAGITDIGENKVQELVSKMNELGDNYINYHQIGYLQTNKVKYIVGRVKLIHSVDRTALLNKINDRAKQLNLIQDVLIQINIAKEDSKSGIYIEDLEKLLNLADKMENIRVKGLMVIAPFFEDPELTRPIFTKAKEIFEDIKNIHYNNIRMEYLSMGMSHDYKIAIECGANIVRVGSTIFGNRKY